MRKDFYDDYGNLRVSAIIVNDQKHGEYKSYHENQQVRADCFYKNDILHGEFKYYSIKGNLIVHSYMNEENHDGEHIDY